jgi:FkbM family methyltransferase
MPIAEPYVLTEAKHGIMLVNRNDFYMGQSLLVYGECSELELIFLLALIKNPGVVVEIGANMGIHTVPIARALAKEGRPFYVFEPQPVIFQQLCANLALNGLTNVRAFPYACGSQNGALTFDIPDYSAFGNFGSTEFKAPGAGSSRSEIVQCIRLDNILGQGEIGLIKIDVEGFELEVLKGCEGILTRCQPFFYVENDRLDKSSALIQWFFDHDYRLWWHIPPLFNGANFRGVAENRYGNVHSFNMLGIHKSKAAGFEGMTEILDANYHPLHDIRSSSAS